MGQLKKENINIRATLKDKKEIQERASINNQTISEYMTGCSLAKTSISLQTMSEYIALAECINAIGRLVKEYPDDELAHKIVKILEEKDYGKRASH